MPSRGTQGLVWLALILMSLSSCQIFEDDSITWEYTIPDGYVGWLAIQYDCPNGQPLNRNGDVIKVSFGIDGLFCTTDSSFAWQGQQFVKNISGASIHIYGHPNNSRGYGVCCQSAFGNELVEAGRKIEITLDLMWVGNQNGYPSLNSDVMRENMLAGKLSPVDW